MQIARAPRKLFQEQVRPKRLNPNKGWILRIKALRTGTQFQILFPVRRCIDHMWFPTNVSGPIGTSDIDGDFLDLRRNGPCPLPPAWAKLRLPGESLSVFGLFSRLSTVSTPASHPLSTVQFGSQHAPLPERCDNGSKLDSPKIRWFTTRHDQLLPGSWMLNAHPSLDASDFLMIPMILHDNNIKIPAVPHKAVAEVSKIGNL